VNFIPYLHNKSFQKLQELPKATRASKSYKSFQKLQELPKATRASVKKLSEVWEYELLSIQLSYFREENNHILPDKFRRREHDV